ncbi:MAG TPA: amidohydrolase [Gemmatimonadales bacterium]|nr:amidohydrolase [Gemmatimonadales bacterium]
MRSVPRSTLLVSPVTILTLLACTAPGPEADLIVENARIWTGDSTNPWAEAMAVRGERLLVVGARSEVRQHRTRHTRVIDAHGRLITPGFIDNHTHFNSAGALLLGVNLLDVSTAEPFTQRVREARERLPEGAWITGGDWGAYEDWQAGSSGDAVATEARARFSPHRSLIDSVTPATGLLLQRWDRTAHLANGHALAAAGLTCAQPVAGLECEGGEMTGRVSGEALRLVRAAQPAKTFEQRLREARVALAHLNELGITGIHDITPRDQFPVYQELKQRGELTVRVYARPTLDKWDELTEVGIPHGFGDAWLKVGGLKGFVDGIQGNSTARFYEPQLHSGLRGSWRDSTNTAATSGPGSGMMPLGNMERNLAGADRAGLWPQVHAIGDEAIDTLLTLYEKVMRENPRRERRYRIIHSQVLRGAHVAERYAQLGIIAEVQPYHAIDDMRWMEERIGERSRWAYAFKTLHDAGVMLTFGSDWPGTNASWYPANPMAVIYAALTRQTLDGNPAGGWFPEERLDLETALRAYTANNAWAAGEEGEKGRLMAGFLADFVILERDLFEIAPEEIKDVRALMTVVGGRIVHDTAEIPRSGPDS